MAPSLQPDGRQPALRDAAGGDLLLDRRFLGRAEARGLQQAGGLRGRKTDNAVLVANHDVTGMHDLTTDGDRDVDRPGRSCKDRDA